MHEAASRPARACLILLEPRRCFELFTTDGLERTKVRADLFQLLRLGPYLAYGDAGNATPACGSSIKITRKRCSYFGEYLT
jgi:hypothetical protein